MATASPADIRNWWELAYVSHFCHIFRPAFHFPDFVVEDLEDALKNDGVETSTEWKLLCDVHVRLLRGILPGRGVNAENWQLHVRKLLRGKVRPSRQPSQDGNSDDDDDEDADSSSERSSVDNNVRGVVKKTAGQWNPLGDNDDYRFISLRDKLLILYKLCEMRLDATDIYDTLKGWEGAYLRLEPVGLDRDGNRYWYMDSGYRLYMEEVAKEPPKPKPKVAKKKTAKGKKVKKKETGKKRGRPPKGSKAASMAVANSGRVVRSSFRNAMTRMSTATPAAAVESSEESDNEEEDIIPIPERLRNVAPVMHLSTAMLGKWSVVAATPEEWTDFVDRMVRSRHADEKRLGRFLQNECLDDVVRRMQLREKQLRKRLLLESMPRRASDRITLMRQVKEEEEKLHAVRVAEAAEQRRRDEEERQRRAVEERRLARERRLQARRVGRGEEEEDYESPKTPSDFDEDTYDTMYKVLEALKRNSNAWLFLEPVTEEIAPNYHYIVKRPMDLSKIEERLDDYKYDAIDEFVEDCRVMFANCRLYNGLRSPYTKMAESMEASLKRQIAKHFPNVPWGDPPVLPLPDPVPPPAAPPSNPQPVKRSASPDVAMQNSKVKVSVAVATSYMSTSIAKPRHPVALSLYHNQQSVGSTNKLPAAFEHPVMQSRSTPRPDAVRRVPTPEGSSAKELHAQLDGPAFHIPNHGVVPRITAPYTVYPNPAILGRMPARPDTRSQPAQMWNLVNGATVLHPAYGMHSALTPGRLTTPMPMVRGQAIGSAGLSGALPPSAGITLTQQYAAHMQRLQQQRVLSPQAPPGTGQIPSTRMPVSVGSTSGPPALAGQVGGVQPFHPATFTATMPPSTQVEETSPNQESKQTVVKATVSTVAPLQASITNHALGQPVAQMTMGSAVGPATVAATAKPPVEMPAKASVEMPASVVASQLSSSSDAHSNSVKSVPAVLSISHHSSLPRLSGLHSHRHVHGQPAGDVNKLSPSLPHQHITQAPAGLSPIFIAQNAKLRTLLSTNASVDKCQESSLPVDVAQKAPSTAGPGQAATSVPWRPFAVTEEDRVTAGEATSSWSVGHGRVRNDSLVPQTNPVQPPS